ncbi:unnamed protein product, partial [Laminaria digitata]
GVVQPCEEDQSPGATIFDPYNTAHDASMMGWDH